jgi:hypothetical protein
VVPESAGTGKGGQKRGQGRGLLICALHFFSCINFLNKTTSLPNELEHNSSNTTATVTLVSSPNLPLHSTVTMFFMFLMFLGEIHQHLFECWDNFWVLATIDFLGVTLMINICKEQKIKLGLNCWCFFVDKST